MKNILRIAFAILIYIAKLEGYLSFFETLLVLILGFILFNITDIKEIMEVKKCKT